MKITLINKLVYFSWIYLLLALVYHFGFIRGYDDAKNDLAKKGYNFEQVQWAFKK